MADNNYSIGNSVNLNTTVAYGTSSVITGFIYPHTFNPVYGVTALNLAMPTISGNNSIPTLSIGTTATFPFEVTWDGISATPTGFYYTITAGNNTPHATDLTTTTFVRVSSRGVALSAGVVGTMSDLTNETEDFATVALATPATYVVNLAAPTLSRSVAYAATVTVPGSASVGTFSPAYGVSSLKIASLSVSGNNSNVTLGITTTATLPATVTWNGLTQSEPIWYTITVANTALHGTTLFTNAVVTASSYAVGLSGGAIAKLSTDQLFTGATVYAITAVGDNTAPSGVSGFTIRPGQTRLGLSWVNPVMADLSAIAVRYSEALPAPATYSSGIHVYRGIEQGTVHTGLTAGQELYYSIFAADNVGNWSSLTTTTSAVGTPFANNTYGTQAFPYKTNAQIASIFVVEGII